MSERKKSYKGFVAGVITGSFIGSVLAVLYTPKSGKAMRREISHKKNELKYNAGKYFENTKEKVSELAQEGREKVEQIVEEAKSKTNQVIKEASEYISQSRDKLLKNN